MFLPIPPIIDSIVNDTAMELSRACASYLLDYRKTAGGGLGVRDPVAHFHLSNGARLERINPSADTSAKRQRESFGLMVNYRYLPFSFSRSYDIECNQTYRYPESQLTENAWMYKQGHVAYSDLIPQPLPSQLPIDTN